MDKCKNCKLCFECSQPKDKRPRGPVVFIVGIGGNDYYFPRAYKQIEMVLRRVQITPVEKASYEFHKNYLRVGDVLIEYKSSDGVLTELDTWYINGLDRHQFYNLRTFRQETSGMSWWEEWRTGWTPRKWDGVIGLSSELVQLLCAKFIIQGQVVDEPVVASQINPETK